MGPTNTFTRIDQDFVPKSCKNQFVRYHLSVDMLLVDVQSTFCFCMYSTKLELLFYTTILFYGRVLLFAVVFFLLKKE